MRMTSTTRNLASGVVIVLLLVIALGIVFYLDGYRTANNVPTPVATSSAPSNPKSENGLIALGLGESGKVGAVTITPREVVEDSRCPSDVQCIWAGRVRVRASIMSGLGTTDQIFFLGESVTTDTEAVTLVDVKPTKVSATPIKSSDYRFIFKVVSQKVVYRNASADLIRVTTPQAGTSEQWGKREAPGTSASVSFPITIEY